LYTLWIAVVMMVVVVVVVVAAVAVAAVVVVVVAVVAVVVVGKGHCRSALSTHGISQQAEAAGPVRWPCASQAGRVWCWKTCETCET
jgi:hypothetical protein